jgi:protein tyrosine phosphatase (PTP) superfamily phosphohydrolase (DUF442 family)
MNTIYNFRKVSDKLACSGQPAEVQLPALAANGYRVVINLGLVDSKYSLKDEAGLVEGLGMVYHHIPVLFDDPQTEELLTFIELMKDNDGDKTLVHCAANYRASVFTGLYLFATKKLDEDGLESFITDVWQPDPVWQSFIEEGIAVTKREVD